MANFTPISAAIGGALIGLAAVLLMLLTGRIAGISGILGGLLNPQTDDRGWRAGVYRRPDRRAARRRAAGYAVPTPQMPAKLRHHCRRRPPGRVRHAARQRLHVRTRHLRHRAAVAALDRRHAIFMVAAIIVVALTHHVFGG